MNSKLFFDLDGTLIDVRRRHIEVYHVVATRMNLPIIPDDEYWERKRNRKFPWDDVSDDICQRFRTNFKEESELPVHLQLDTSFPGIVPLLTDLQTQYTLILLTKRYHRENLLRQLDALSLEKFFSTILTPNPGTKREAVKTYGYSQNDTIIGDTEEDIQTASDLQLTSVAVTWGVRTKEYLTSFHPTYLFLTISELKRFLWNAK